jgi:RNA polymerase sigma-70 factor (ECF subfamily)
MAAAGNSTGNTPPPSATAPQHERDASSAPAATGDAAASGDSGNAALRIPDDRELLARIIGGGRDGEQAFRSLVDRHARYLFGVARSLASNEQDAEDLVQETLAAVLQSAATFRGGSQVRTWIVAILVRKAAMMRRTQSRRIRPQMSIDAHGEGAASPSAAMNVARPPGAEASDARLDVAQMLSRLTEEHRQVIVLRELEGMSYDQIAEALDVPRGTVESRLFRAREELRKRFKGYGS